MSPDRTAPECRRWQRSGQPRGTAAGRALIGLVLVVLGACEIGGDDWVTEAVPGAGPPKYIAHAGGMAGERGGTNSLQALDASAAAGFGLIEIDFCWTTDNQLVLLHDWTVAVETLFGAAPGQPSHEQFLGWTAVDGLTQLDLDGLARWMADHPRVSIVTDAKSDNLRALGHIAERHPDLVPRFVPQIHGEDELEPVAALGYERIIYTLYTSPASDAEVLATAARADLFAVTMPTERAAGSLPHRLDGLGVFTYAHTLNEHLVVSRLMAGGIDGVYTDRLSPALDRRDADPDDDGWASERDGELVLQRSVLVLDLIDVLGPEAGVLTVGRPSDSERPVVLEGWGRDGRPVGQYEVPAGDATRELSLAAAFPGVTPAWLSTGSEVELSVAWSVRDRPGIRRVSTSLAHRSFVHAGPRGHVDGVRVTIVNPTDQPARVSLKGPAVDSVLELEPGQLIESIVRLGTDDDPARVEVVGAPVVIQPLRADIALSDVR